MLQIANEIIKNVTEQSLNRIYIMEAIICIYFTWNDSTLYIYVTFMQAFSVSREDRHTKLMEISRIIFC